MINIEELRADIEAGTPGDWFECSGGVSVLNQECWATNGIEGVCRTHKKYRRRIARLPQLEREYLAMREALEWISIQGLVGLYEKDGKHTVDLEDGGWWHGMTPLEAIQNAMKGETQ